MYGINSGAQPFDVFVRQENTGEVKLVIKFECKEGMGVLGIRKIDRVDPPPSAVYQEADVDPESLRAGRFVHVLGSGQRQSYALSRLTPEIAARLPTDAWVELKPHSEYGFRYLVVPDEALQPERTAAAVAAVAAPAAAAPAAGAAAAAPVAVAVAKPKPVALPSPAAPAAPVAPGPSASSVPTQVPMAPALAESTLQGLSKDAAVQHLREEMAKVSTLHAEVARLAAELAKSHQREKDLLGMLTRWRET
jgi:hypothetical protein